MLAPAEGEGLEDGGGRTPTRDETRPRLGPLARPAAFLSAATVGSAAPSGAGDGAGPRRRGTSDPGGTGTPGLGASPGSGPGAPVHGHIGFLAPVTASARGRRERKWDARSQGSASSREPKWPAGKAGGRRGNRRLPELATVTSAGLGALPPRRTPPRLTTRKRPWRPRAAALVAPAPPAGRKGGDPRRAGGRGEAAEGGGGQGGRREDGAGSLLEHGLLLLLFFLLTIHDSQDDFPLLFREVAEVRHLGLRRRLRGRRGGSRAAPGPERSRHVWRSRTTLGKQGGNSAGSRGSGAGGWGSLRGWDKCIQINGLQSEATAPLPQERRQGEGRAEGGGLRSALGEMFLLPGGEGLPSERFAGARSWRPRRGVRGAAGEGGGVRWRGRLRVG